jgi:raffinose/stachyose/melibiose transport system permease protein
MSDRVTVPTVPVDAGAGRRPQAPAGRSLELRPAGRPRKPGRLRKRLELLLLLGPGTLLFAGFVVLPICLAAYYSVFDWSGFGPPSDFVGAQNYTQVFEGQIFRGAVMHNVILVVASLVLQLPVILGVSLLLNRRLRGQSVLRTLVFAPFLLSEATTAVIWLLMLQPNGTVDDALGDVGLGGLVHQWLASPDLVLGTLFVVISWKYAGFGILLILAGLQGVPDELRESAALDGATRNQITRFVLLPLLGPTIRIWMFLSVIGSLQLFDLVWIMTDGGPADASTTMVTYVIDHGFQRYEFGYGSAAAVILFAVCLVFALIYQRYALRRDTSGALTRMVG